MGQYKPRLLGADSESEICDLLPRILTSDKYDLVTTCDPREAMRMAVEAQVVVTSMPKVVEYAKKRGIPVVYISGLPDPDCVRAATRTFTKPFNIEELERAVSELTEHLKQGRTQ